MRLECGSLLPLGLAAACCGPSPHQPGSKLPGARKSAAASCRTPRSYTSHILKLHGLAAALFLALAPVSPADERAELRALEMKIEIVRRLFPLEFDAEEEKRYIRGTAEAAGLVVDVKADPKSEPVRHEDGFPSPITIHRVDVSGRAALQDISLFIEFLGKRDWRAGDLESLQLKRDGDAYRFRARLALPTFDPVDPLPGLARQRTNLALAVARAKPQRLIAAVQALAQIPDDEGVYVANAEITDRLSMEGVVLGARARAGLAESFEGIAIAAGEGPCRPFTWPSKELKPGLAALCESPPRKHLGNVAVRGTGPLTIRLRDVDVGGAFYVLHDLTGENFVVDTDVKGRLNVDVENATLEETLRAVRSAGLAVGEGPLRRVSLIDGKRGPAPADDYTGEPLSFQFQDASVRDVLCVFSHISGLEIVAPSGLRDRTTLYAADLPWDRVLTQLVYSAGLRYSIEGTRINIGEERPGLNVCTEVAQKRDGPFTSVRMMLERSSASDLKLAGVGKAADTWKAYVFVPWRWLAAVAPGQELFDARVRSVGEKGFELVNAP